MLLSMSRAASHRRPFSHAVVAALNVTAFGRRPNAGIELRRRSALELWSPFAQALMAASHVTTETSNLCATAAENNDHARCQRPFCPQALIAALSTTMLSSRPLVVASIKRPTAPAQKAIPAKALATELHVKRSARRPPLACTMAAHIVRTRAQRKLFWHTLAMALQTMASISTPTADIPTAKCKAFCQRTDRSQALTAELRTMTFGSARR